MRCLKTSPEKLAGTLIFVGTAQFILFATVAEALYPDYSISNNYISDLGVGPSAPLFNSSVLVLGLSVVASVYLLRHVYGKHLVFLIFLFLCGIGAVGAGLFPANLSVIHQFFSMLAFLFGALSAVASLKIQKSPFSYIAAILGLFSLVAFAMFTFSEYLFYVHSVAHYFNLGKGGLERMIAYPIFLWALGFGGHLAGKSVDNETLNNAP
jgi:hypothetical membrane protein